MGNKEIIARVRGELDALDSKLVGLLQERMALIDEIAEAKRAENMPTTDESREQQIVERALRSTAEEYKGEVVTFVRTLLSLSKFRQRKLLFDSSEDPCCPSKDPAEVTFAQLPRASRSLGRTGISEPLSQAEKKKK